MNHDHDYPLSSAPESSRRGFWSMSALLLGFTFFTATMWAGGSLGTAFKLDQLLTIIITGNVILGGYAAALSYIAYKTGLNTAILGRYCFGEQGCKLSDVLLGFTQIGWYAWGVATIAIVLVKLLELPDPWLTPLMILFGMGFCVTASLGVKAMELLSKVSVPLMLAFIGLSFFYGIQHLGGLSAISDIVPTDSMGFGAAITVVIGTFISGGTQATNWSRFSQSSNVAIGSTMLAFFIGNGLMVLVGAFGAMIYQESDIVNVLVLQGFLVSAVIMLFANLWTTQDNTIYNFAAAGCNLVRTEKRRLITVIGAAIGTVMAVLGMYNYLIPFLVLLGTFIPPIGAVIIADFWLRFKGNPPKIEDITLPNFNIIGLASYFFGSACAYYSPWLPPLIGMLASFIAYALLLKIIGSKLPMKISNSY